MHTGFKLAIHHIALCKRPGADTEETGRYDLAWKNLIASVLNALVINELSKGIVISFMFMDIYNPSENSCFSKIFHND